MWGCGYAMTTLVEDDSPLEELLFDLHISVGVTLLALLVLRIAIRLVHRPPPLPATIQGLERRAAHLGHAALYALPALVHRGRLGGDQLRRPCGAVVRRRDAARLPRDRGGPSQDLAEDVHMWLAYAMLAVAAGHVAAAFKHRWLDGHDVIRRMTFGGG